LFTALGCALIAFVERPRFALELAGEVEQGLAPLRGVTFGDHSAAGGPQAQYFGFGHGDTRRTRAVARPGFPARIPVRCQHFIEQD
jgi:hypothetical protein